MIYTVWWRVGARICQVNLLFIFHIGFGLGLMKTIGERAGPKVSVS